MKLRLLAAVAALALAQSPVAHAQAASAAKSAASAVAGAAKDAAKAAAPAAPAAAKGETSEGKVAYYGRKFAGRKTASGERFNPGALTMAHKTLPFGTLVKVTNTKNNRSVVVRVNDRGPSSADLVGDVSLAAANQLRMVRAGKADVKLEVVGTAKGGRAKR